MATADKLVNLADLKTAYDTTVRHDAAQTLTLAQQRTARDNIGAADAGVTGMIIDPVAFWGDDGTKSNTGIRMTRTGGDVYTLLCATTPSGSEYFKLSKSLDITSTAANRNGWAYEVALEEGVAYTLTLTPLSGTINGTGRQIQMWLEDGSTSTPWASMGFGGGSIKFVWPDATKKLKLVAYIMTTTTTGENGYTFRLTLTKNHPVDNAIPVSGSTPTITALAGCRYICSATAVTELTFTPPENGLCAVRFASGSTATVLTLPNTVKMPSWWTGPEASRTYEISFEDGYGVVTSWA